MEKKICFNALKIEKDGIDLTSDENVVKIKGYGCHFNVANKNHEIVTEDSFRSFFNDLQGGGLMPSLTFNHNSDLVIGGWDKIEADENGLVCEGTILKNIDIVKDRVLPLIENGYLCGLSTEGFSYDWDYDEEADAVRLNDFNLLAISLVSVPADFSAQMEVANALKLERQRKKKKMENAVKRRLFQ